MPQAIDLRRVAEWAGHDGRRDPGAEPRAAPLDDAGQVSEVRGEGARRHGRPADARSSPRPRRPTSPRSSGTRAKKGETLLTVARRFGVSRADVAEANNLSRQVAPAPRPGTDHPARAGDAARGPQPSAPRRRPWRPARSRSRRQSPAVTTPAHGRARHLQGQARRHALLDRPALRHHRREDQDLEPPDQQSHRARRDAEDPRHAIAVTNPPIPDLRPPA